MAISSRRWLAGSLAGSWPGGYGGGAEDLALDEGGSEHKNRGTRVNINMFMLN